jgi:hypothetical protein
MADPTRLSYFASVVSVAALAVGIFAWMGGPRSSTRSASPRSSSGLADDADPSALAREVVRLRSDVDALNAKAAPGSLRLLAAMEERLAAVESALGQRAGDAGAATALSSAPPLDPLDRFRPVYTEIKSSSSSVTIHQNADRMFVVSNSDPALANTLLSVQAVRADGTVEPYTIVVPAPDDSAALR